MHTFLDSQQQLLGVSKIAEMERGAIAHRDVPAIARLLPVAQSGRDDRYLCLPVLLRHLHHLDEAGPEREKGFHIGFGCGVRIDIGIAFGKNDQR